MPIYAYKCRTCEHQFEARQRFSDNPLTECPVCNGDIRRVISPVGIVFKGSGFYVTDNRNGKSNGAVTGASKKQEAGSTSKSDESGQKESTAEQKTDGVGEAKKGASDSAQSTASA